MKRFIATLIAFTLILSVLMTSVSASSATYTNAAEIAQLVDDGYNQGTKGPITITKGTLRTTFSSKTVYLITLSGTEWVFNQSTEALTDLFSGFNLQNSYYYNVVNIISANVPKGSNLILAGHSLGGMIAQQVAADTTIKRNYNILNTVTFGSPLLSNGSREGTVRRLGDVSDIVTLLSVQTILSPLRALAGLNREDGGYYLQPITAHTECYTRTDVWGKYDVTGTKYVSAKLILDLSTRTFFKSPIF